MNRIALPKWFANWRRQLILPVFASLFLNFSAFASPVSYVFDYRVTSAFKHAPFSDQWTDAKILANGAVGNGKVVFSYQTSDAINPITGSYDTLPYSVMLTSGTETLKVIDSMVTGYGLRRGLSLFDVPSDQFVLDTFDVEGASGVVQATNVAGNIETQNYQSQLFIGSPSKALSDRDLSASNMQLLVDNPASQFMSIWVSDVYSYGQSYLTITNFRLEVAPSAAPEPNSLFLFLLALITLGVINHRTKQ